MRYLKLVGSIEGICNIFKLALSTKSIGDFMKLFLTVLLLLYVGISQGQFAFEKKIAITDKTYAGRAIEASDHSIFYCGTYYDATVGHLIVGKLDFEGNEIWQSFFDTDVESCWGLVQLPDNTLVLGYEKDNYIVLLKVSETGDSLTSTHVNPNGGQDAFLDGTSLDVSESGVLFFSAYDYGLSPLGDPYAGAHYERYSSSLTLIEYGVPTKFTCSLPATSYPSQVKCEGNTRSWYGKNLQGAYCAPQANLGLMDSNGDSIWLKNLWLRSIGSIALNESGNCFVSSSYYDDTSYISKYDSIGNLLWETKLNYDWHHTLLAASPENGVIATHSGVSLNRYNEDGNYLWSHQVGNGFYFFELKNLERCHDNSYLGCATVRDSFTLDYAIYLFRTKSDEILGVQDQSTLASSKNSFHVFPNPSKDYCKIALDKSLPSSSQCLHIKDLFGRILYSSCPANCETILDVAQFPKGIYLAELLNDEDEITSQLFVVQ